MVECSEMGSVPCHDRLLTLEIENLHIPLTGTYTVYVSSVAVVSLIYLFVPCGQDLIPVVVVIYRVSSVAFHGH